MRFRKSRGTYTGERSQAKLSTHHPRQEEVVSGSRDKKRQDAGILQLAGRVNNTRTPLI